MADSREMTLKRAKELVDHCRYCGMPDYRPKCKADYEHQIAEIAAALAELEADNAKHREHALLYQQERDALREQEARIYSKIAKLCEGYDSEHPHIGQAADLKKQLLAMAALAVATAPASGSNRAALAEKCMDHSDCNWKGCQMMVDLEAQVCLLRQRVKELESVQISYATYNHDIEKREQAARVEGLRLVKRQSELLDWEEFAAWLDAEIAALERGGKE